MTNIDRAAGIIQQMAHPPAPSDPAVGSEIAPVLADDGLLMPDPTIIRTVAEMDALDPDTMLVSEDWDGLLSAGFCQNGGRQAISHEHCFPVAVSAPADQVRAAYKALEEA